MSKTIPVITIDGPSGSGKGTISLLLARKLGWHFLDSGVLYRALALEALEQHVNLTDVSALRKLALDLDIEFITISDRPPKVMLKGRDVSGEIRTERCSEAASQVATLPDVRKALLKHQKSFRCAPGLVADGRDMGRVVFPHADIKIYLTANYKERAKRRYQQLQDQGINVSLRDILQDLIERDSRDEKRNVSPLKPAKDAKIIDTSGLSIDEVLQQVINVVKEKGFCCAEA